jgi:hypothetical protein
VLKAQQKKINFEWLLNKKWNSIYVEAGTESIPMKVSLEQFIYEHYAVIQNRETPEYKLQHPSWLVNEVIINGL